MAIAASVQCIPSPAAGVRQHARAALVAGAEAGEILEVCELIVGLGGHTVLMGTPLLMREIAGTS